MDALHKLQQLGSAMHLEPAEEVNVLGQITPAPITPDDLKGCIQYATLPGGKRVPLLKTMLSSACERDCRYCPFRSGRDFERTSFSPDELARLGQQLYQKKLIHGIFLSSAVVGGGPHTQDRLLATAELLRRKYRFEGYLHLKIMPGAERDQIAASLRWADRVSINLEAPNAQRLITLAPHKVFDGELVRGLRWSDELRRTLPGRRPSMTTQFVVGPADERDVELLATTAFLYHDLKLARAYFSAFNPIPDTPLFESAPTPPLRQSRLYQASFLLRDYGFDVEELPFGGDGNLPTDVDPKLAWARLNLSEAPVEVNTADRERLLRIPGIGQQAAERILAARQLGALRDLTGLRKLGIAAQRAAPFILLDGHRPPEQLRLL